jgi:hypothetical protein
MEQIPIEIRRNVSGQRGVEAQVLSPGKLVERY